MQTLTEKDRGRQKVKTKPRKDRGIPRVADVDRERSRETKSGRRRQRKIVGDSECRLCQGKIEGERERSRETESCRRRQRKIEGD